MGNSNPHLLKGYSLFAMFCLSYLPLFFLVSLKIFLAGIDYLYFGGFNTDAIIIFFKKFGAIFILFLFSIYGFIGTHITIKNIKKQATNAFPAKVASVNPKNEEALSYLATYIIPLIASGTIGIFEYATFTILFIIYYKLYSTSSLILINPILNMKYGLFDLEYEEGTINSTKKKALIISENNWLSEGDNIKLIKISNRLYFALQN